MKDISLTADLAMMFVAALATIVALLVERRRLCRRVDGLEQDLASLKGRNAKLVIYLADARLDASEA